MRTREQEYAAKVFNQVTSRLKEFKQDQKNGDRRRKEYGSMAHKLPVLIRTAGLAQALAFVEARDKQEKEAQRRLLDDLAATLDKESRAKLLERSREASLDEYMLLTRYALDALLWYKRFAQTVLDVNASDDIREGQ